METLRNKIDFAVVFSVKGAKELRKNNLNIFFLH